MIHLRNWFGLGRRSILQLVALSLVRWALEIAVESFANLASVVFAYQLMAVEPKVFDLVADSNNVNKQINKQKNWS